MRKWLIAAAAAGMLLNTGFAQQVKTPRPSPGAMVSQDVGLTKIEINYSRPGVKDRQIFGKLVEYGKVWRTGANAATTIEFKSDVKIEGQDLKAGKYALLTIPGETEWTVIFSKNDRVSVPNYKEEEDALRVTVPSKKYGEKVETFTINFTDVKDGSLMIQLLWENTSVSFKVETNADAMVMKTIDKAMAGTSSRDYYVAAQYFYNNDKDMEKAMMWINKAVEMDKEDPKFWVIHWQAKILAKAGKKKEAIAAAEMSKKLAIEEKYDSYVKRNDELLEELKAKK